MYRVPRVSGLTDIGDSEWTWSLTLSKEEPRCCPLFGGSGNLQLLSDKNASKSSFVRLPLSWFRFPTPL